MTNERLDNIGQRDEPLHATKFIGDDAVLHSRLFELFEGVVDALALGYELCRTEHLLQREVGLIDAPE